MAMCSYCHLRRIRRSAKESGATVRLRSAPMAWYSAGVNVFVVPKGEKLDTSTDARGNHGKQFVMWAAEIGKRCGC